MDPSATFASMQTAYRDENWEALADFAEALMDWMEKGGFPPALTGNLDWDRYVARCVCSAVLAWEV